VVVIGPRPYLVGVNKMPLASGREYLIRTIPAGSPWRLRYILVSYQESLELGALISNDLAYHLYDADGRTFSVDPIVVPMVTSPARNRGLAATNPLNVDYPGGTSVKLEITVAGGLPFNGLPASVSITLYGVRGWEGYGK